MASPLQGLPVWAQQLSEKYYSRTIALFVLHRNVRDLVPWTVAEGRAPQRSTARRGREAEA